MNPHAVQHPRRSCVSGFVLALAAAFALAPNPVWAVGGDGIFYSSDPADGGAYFSSQNTFRIPFGDVDRRIQEVILYVSTDFGRNYQKVTSAGPADKEFRFEAKRDGWYWFTVQTRDADGRYAPPDLGVAQPQIKVCVDTHPPVATLRWLPPQNGTIGVAWEADDYNLDATTLRVDYRATGGDWMPLPVKQAATGQYYWNPGPGGPFEARIQVQDKAHNPAEAKTAPSGPDYKTGTGPLPGPGPGPSPSPNPATPSASAPDNTIMVNTKRIELNFKIDDIGSSKVKAVEVWYTQDGRTWQKTPEDAPPEPPYVVKVQSEGRYGFTLIARSGVGLALPAPKSGDAPQVWVEVDETKPVVHILGVEVGRGPDSGYVTVRWSATDKHMSANPVTISYVDATAGPAGQWQVMASNVPNGGSYVWRMPDGLPPQILVRVEAIDQAGNIGQDETPKPVSTDLSIPKAHVIEVHPARTPDTGAGPTTPP